MPASTTARALVTLLLALSFLGGVGCGDDQTPPLPNVEDCSGGWTAMTRRYGSPMDPTLPPSVLALNNGILFYPLAHQSEELVSLPANGPGTETHVTDGWASAMEIEGDQLVFAEATRFYTAPLAGGAPTQLFDDTPNPMTSSGSFLQAISPTDFFYAVDGLDGTDLYRQSRAGGPPAQLAVIPGQIFLDVNGGIAVTSDAVLLATDEGVAVAVPLDGSGAVSNLANGGLHYAGIDTTGAYSWSPVGIGENSILTFVPADGSPARPFWPRIPPHVAPWRVTATGDGTWMVSALARFSDGLTHLAFWIVDGAGNGRLTACDPGGGSLSPLPSAGPVFAADAAYIAAEYVEGTGQLTWEITRVAR
jgi:hypothetical protein